MKKLLLISTIFFSVSSFSQNINWYYNSDTVTAAGWPALYINIPNGTVLDSVYGGFLRPGVPTVASEDWACAFGGVSPWSYQDTNSSLYNHWIDLTSFNFVGPATFVAAVPDGANPVIWDSLGVATHSILGIVEQKIEERELLIIVDLMGRETEFKPNTPLIFIYTDGTRERVMKLEE